MTLTRRAASALLPVAALVLARHLLASPPAPYAAVTCVGVFAVAVHGQEVVPQTERCVPTP
jgi:hypothetical protein